MAKEKATLDASVAEGCNDLACCLMRVTFFDLVQFGGDLCLMFWAVVVTFSRRFVGFGLALGLRVSALGVGDVVGGVFGLAPGLAGCAFDLLGCSGVGDLLVAYGFAERLFDFAC